MNRHIAQNLKCDGASDFAGTMQCLAVVSIATLRHRKEQEHDSFPKLAR
jgi:hypothetical protein